MSKKKDNPIEDIVKNVTFDFYYISKKKKYFWQSSTESISFRIRDKNQFNKNPEIVINIRAFLLSKDKIFFDFFYKTVEEIQERDRKQLERYIISVVKSETSLNEKRIRENIGIYAINFPEDELKAALDLEDIISCRIFGYEKEFFNLKCYSLGYLPNFIVRVLYHMKYDHSEFERSNKIKLNKPLKLEYMLKKISFS